MTVLESERAKAPMGGIVNAALTTALRGYAVDYWPAHEALIGGAPGGVVVSALPVAANPRSITGALSGSYLRDFYYRVQINPIDIALGNLVSEQQRPVRVWNAWLSRTVAVSDIVVAGDSAITLSGQGDPPVDLAPLQERTWQLTIGANGAASVDTTVQWQFDADPTLTVHITGQRVTAWTFAPNWDHGITERLEWLTLLERGTNGDETSTPLRETPRRSWEFMPLVFGAERQRMEAMLYDASARSWAVPVWPDIAPLVADLAAGATSIPVVTAGTDYHAGGLAIIRADAATFETVEIDSISDSAITLVRGTLGEWPAGTAIYPARTARLEDYPTLNRYTTRLVDATVRFIGEGASDHAAQAPAATYRGMPVLEDRPEWSENPTTQYNRDVELIDSDTGVVLIDDISGLPWPIQSHRWQVYGSAARDALRGLLYYFAGQVNRVWLPTWQDDLTPVADAATTVIDVAHCGYTAYLHGQAGRRDIRMQLVDGTVLYRRITASTELSNAVERLQVDSAWPATIAQADIQSISYMGLCRLDTDAVEIVHRNANAGVAECAVTFAQVTANG